MARGVHDNIERPRLANWSRQLVSPIGLKVDSQGRQQNSFRSFDRVPALRTVGGGETVGHFGGPVGAVPPLAGSGVMGAHERGDVWLSEQ